MGDVSIDWALARCKHGSLALSPCPLCAEENQRRHDTFVRSEQVKRAEHFGPRLPWYRVCSVCGETFGHGPACAFALALSAATDKCAPTIEHRIADAKAAGAAEERARVVAHIDKMRVRYIAEREQAVRDGDMPGHSVLNGIVVGLVLLAADFVRGDHHRDPEGTT